MKIAELIAIAKIRSAKRQEELAAEMQISPSRLTNIGKGKLQPTSSEIVYLARQANTDAINALAEIESERAPHFASTWKAVAEDRARTW